MSIASIQTAPRPAARPPASEPAPSGEGDFAQLMALQAPADEAPQPSRPEEARQARSRHAARSMVRSTPAEPPREPADVAKAPRDPARTADEGEPAPVTVDAAMAQWLQSLHRPDAAGEPATEGADTPTLLAGSLKQPGSPQARPDATSTDKPDPNVTAVDGRTAHGHTGLRAAEKAPREVVAATEPLAARGADEAVAAAAPAAREAAAAPSSTGFTLPAGFEPVSTPAPGASPVAAETPVLAVPMPVPLESPEFAQAFGLEISTLARDGIQQAELHLNPAEMGPVSVQIALDGEKARIDFGAQAAATRAAIEASLPDLAAALRDAGLTLAGGGVSQHPGQRGDGRSEGETGSARPFGRERADTVTAAPARAVLRSRAGPGGVDLYA